MRKSAGHSKHSISLAGIAVFGEWGRGASAVDGVSCVCPLERGSDPVYRAGRLGSRWGYPACLPGGGSLVHGRSHS